MGRKGNHIQPFCSETVILETFRSIFFNPIRARGGVIYDSPPLVFFYPHFSCVRARDLNCFNFSNNVKTNLVQ